MADTTVTTGKTIDNLDMVAEAYPNDAEKQAYFKANGIIPVRSKGASGETKDDMKTCQVPLSELIPTPAEQVQADWNQTTTTAKDYIKNKPHFSNGLQVTNEAGYDNVELHINSTKPGLLISQYGLGIETDDTLGPSSDASFILGVTHPVPNPEDASDGDVLIVENGEPTWINLGSAGIVYDGNISLQGLDEAEFDTVPVKTDYGRGFYGLNWMPLPHADNVSITQNAGELSVANPVPAPAANHADAGKVLTVKTVNDSDEIVWEAPQGGGGIDLPKGEASWNHLDSGGGLYIPLLAYYEWNGTHAGQSVTRIVLDDDDSNWKKPL